MCKYLFKYILLKVQTYGIMLQLTHISAESREILVCTLFSIQHVRFFCSVLNLEQKFLLLYLKKKRRLFPLFLNNITLTYLK